MCCRIAEGDLTPETHPFEIDAPDIAGKLQAGQFVVFRADAREECMPPTVASWDRNKGTVPVLFPEAGRTTPELAAFEAGDSPTGPSGCLSMTSLIRGAGTTAFFASEFTIASVAPVARATEQAHSKVIASMGLQTRDLVFGAGSLRSAGDELKTAADKPVSKIPELKVCAVRVDKIAAAIAPA